MKLNTSQVQYVIFDWDNTLAESRSTLVLAVNQVLKEYGLPEWEVVKHKRNHDLSFRDNFPLIFGAEKADEAYEHYVELYKTEVKKHIRTFPGVKEVLNYFAERQIPMIIMSNKDRRLMEIELPLLFDKNLFYRIVCGREAPRDKPYPDQVYHALNGLLKPEEITPDKVWVIGDSPMDSTAAEKANALPIRIGRSIWGDEGAPETKFIYFNCFNEFYSHLTAEKK